VDALTFEGYSRRLQMGGGGSFRIMRRKAVKNNLTKTTIWSSAIQGRKQSSGIIFVHGKSETSCRTLLSFGGRL